MKLFIEYHQAEIFYQYQQYGKCGKEANRSKLILFWTKIFSSSIDVNAYNGFLLSQCRTDRCQVTNDHQRLCESDAVIFHARGGIRMDDMPRERSSHQRYVLLTKEPPYKTTAIVGHLNYFFNWTATYRLDSDIDYSYFYWRRKQSMSIENNNLSYLNNREARAAVMISNCYSQNKREDYLERLQTIVPVTRIGHCSGNKCRQSRYSCLEELQDTHPFYLAFENSLCQDYVTEKYANVILNSRMIPIVFAQNVHRYIPNSFIDANQFSSPEQLGQYLRQLTANRTAYDTYFQWKNQYELLIPNENDYLCQLCHKLNDPNEPTKVYASMKQWLYDDAHCQRWISNLNTIIDISVEETMDYQDPWF